MTCGGLDCRLRIANKHASAHTKANPSGTPIPAPTATRGMVLEAHTGAEGEALVFEAAFADKAGAVAVTVKVAGTIVEPPAIETVTVAAVEGELMGVEILRKSAK